MITFYRKETRVFAWLGHKPFLPIDVVPFGSGRVLLTFASQMTAHRVMKSRYPQSQCMWLCAGWGVARFGPKSCFFSLLNTDLFWPRYLMSSPARHVRLADETFSCFRRPICWESDFFWDWLLVMIVGSMDHLYSALIYATPAHIHPFTRLSNRRL